MYKSKVEKMMIDKENLAVVNVLGISKGQTKMFLCDKSVYRVSYLSEFILRPATSLIIQPFKLINLYVFCKAFTVSIYM